jgi:hypothetical protein
MSGGSVGRLEGVRAEEVAPSVAGRGRGVRWEEVGRRLQ